MDHITSRVVWSFARGNLSAFAVGGVLALILSIASDACAQNFRGGRAAAGRGGQIAGGQAAARARSLPAARPNLAARPSVPSMSPGGLPSRPGGMGSGGGRPNLGGSNLGGANLGGAGVSRPGTGLGGTRLPDVNRPGISRPAVSRPGANLPGANLPGTGPSGMQRPAPLPGIADRPLPRPDRPFPPVPDRPIAGGRPSLKPAQPLPEIGRDATRPSLPDLGGGRPALPGISARPGRPEFPGRPDLSDRPAISRPSPGDVGDFLGLDRPLRPETLPELSGPDTRPAPLPDRERPTTRPSLPVDRPGLADRPGLSDRPGFTDRPVRPGWTDRPDINIGEINIGNNLVINSRPTWVNQIDRSRITVVSNRWGNQIGGLHDWRVRHPARIAFWNRWGSGVRGYWGLHVHVHGWFGPDWWYVHRHPWAAWHYGFAFPRFGFRHWWTVSTFDTCVGWFAWGPPPAVWSQPIFYDYGPGGNVVFENNVFYIDGQSVGTAEEVAASAMELATVAPPDDETQAQEAEWLPLGTFAVSAGEQDVEPTRLLQLAVNQDGILSGTLFNTHTEQATTVQGQVDRETQRVAIRIGESDQVVLETGLYNLTLEEAPALVHLAPGQTETWLLVRLDPPEDEDAPPSDVPASGSLGPDASDL